jgi:hypothetical protein
MKAWITNELPDSDLTVLIRIEHDAEPIVIGFHDGECWRDIGAGRLESPVNGWMNLDAAAAILDAAMEEVDA